MNMKKEYIQRYFTILKNQFEVKKSIRELVIFSKHNIISDSPFLRLDFISCRNMLIYFNQTLQNRFFPIVHYALKQDGLLLLGKSETIGQNVDLFIPLEKNEKLFKAQYTGIKEPPRLYNYALTYKGYNEAKHEVFKNEEEALEDKIVEATRTHILSKCVVINSSNEIVYIQGENPYLTHPQGRTSNNIFKSIKEELVLDLRSVLNEVQKNKKENTTHFRSVTLFETITKYVRILVVPIKNDKNDDWFYSLFFQTEDVEDIQAIAASNEDSTQAIDKLQLELTRTKSHLQNVIEELETSYEEMQSLNEELSSSNEELQSSNEELETTNEELQSTNEELQTAYSELKVLYDDKELKARQLEELTQMLKSQTEDYRKQKELTEAIINTTPVAITMVDANGRLTYVNANAQKLFGFSSKELVNRSYDSAKWSITALDGTPFPQEMLPFSQIKKRFDSVYNIEHAIQTSDKKRLFISVSGSPLFDVNGAFMGAVFSIEDITKSSQLQEDLRIAKESKELAMIQELTKGIADAKSIDLGQHLTHQINILRIGMFDIATEVKNRLGEINVIANTLLNAELPQNRKDKLSKEFETSIHELDTMMQDHLNFYKQLFYTSKTNFIDMLHALLLLLSKPLKEYHIIIDNRLESSTDIRNVSAKEALTFIFEFLSTLIQIQQIYQKERRTDVCLMLQGSASSRYLLIDISGLGDTDLFSVELGSYEELKRQYKKLFKLPLELMSDDTKHSVSFKLPLMSQ
ncbi:MAG: PAS domain S-box protein [Epsilonproteobacteria bacterium]|nr:PAS domain S-box protein [Campylobacterota bacterium]